MAVGTVRLLDGADPHFTAPTGSDASAGSRGWAVKWTCCKPPNHLTTWPPLTKMPPGRYDRN